MELFIQKRLKDLRVERGLKPKQFAAQIYSSKFAQGSYEISPALAIVRHAKNHSVFLLLQMFLLFSVETVLLQQRRQSI